METRAAVAVEAGKPLTIETVTLEGPKAGEVLIEIKASGINAVIRLDWSVHIPPEWPAKALVWMCSDRAKDQMGQEVSLRDEGIRRRIGLA